MLGLGDLPVLLRYFIVAVSVSGPVLAVLVATSDPPQVTASLVARGTLLTVLAAIAERSTLHLTHKTAVNVSAAAYLGMVITLPTGLSAPLAFVSGFIGQGSRRRHDLAETLFNASQGAIAVLIASATFHAARGLPLGPDITGLGGVGLVMLTAATYYAANTALVASAVGLQLRTNPFRVWLVTLREDLPEQGSMAALGAVIAHLSIHQPFMVPVLAAPLVLVHRAIEHNVRLRLDTQQALAHLVEIVELRDPYTAGHSRRVAALARQIALALGLTHEEADVIESAGRVHDLGKVAIDPTVLMKPAKLTVDEQREMERHPVLGADVLAKFAAYREGTLLVRHHHERWDGKGYPDRLTGEAIPLGARILAVADTFDALTSDRPYRAGMSVEQAVQILREGAGTQWDPAAVEALLDILAEQPERLPTHRTSPVDQRHSTDVAAA